MSVNQEFAARIARIEARACGKLPPAPVIAPFVGEEVRAPRKRRSGFGRLLLPVLGLGLVVGLFGNEIIALLPPEVVASSSVLSGLVGTLGVTVDATPAATADTVPDLTSLLSDG